MMTREKPVSFRWVVARATVAMAAAACDASQSSVPEPPEDTFPLAISDPESQLPTELMAVAEEKITNPNAEPVADAAHAARGVRYVPHTRVQTDLGANAAPSRQDGTMLLPGNRGLQLQRSIGSVSQPVIFDEDNRTLVPSTLDWPGRALVKEYVTWPNGMSGGCSGTLIGRKYVLTAGHCVYNPDKGGWAASVRVVPGLDGTYMPFGAAWQVYYDSVQGWTNDQNNDYDYAMITLDRNLGYATGWLGLASLSDDTMDGMWSAIQGYPGDVSGGTRQYVASGPIENFDSTMIYYSIDTMPGDSGAILHATDTYSDYIFGVHTGDSYFWLSHYNNATRINNSRFYQIQDWMNSNAGLGTVGGDFTYWSSIGGTTYTNPTAVPFGGGRYDVFVRGTNGAVYHKLSSASGWWPSQTGWEYLGGSITDSVAAVSRGTNQIDMFVRGTDGALYTKALNNSTWWPAGTGWAWLGGSITGSPVAVTWGWNRLDVFARATDGGVLWYKWTGAAWAAPVNLGGDITDHPTAASWGPARIDLFARAASGNLIHNWYDGVSWKGWDNHGGYLGSAPTAVSPKANVLEVFVRDGGSGVWHQRWENGWSGWISLGGNITDEVAAVVRMPGQVDIFVRDAGGATYTKALNNAGVWWPGIQSWAWLGGDQLGTLGVVSTAWNQIAVIARGFENGLRLRWWDGARWWL